MSSSAYQRSVNTFTSQTVHFLSDQFGSCQRLLNTCPSTSGIELFYVKQAAMLSGFTAKRVKILNPSTTYLSLISVANPILDFTSYLHIHQHRQLRRFHNSHSHINWMYTLHLHNTNHIPGWFWFYAQNRSHISDKYIKSTHTVHKGERCVYVLMKIKLTFISKATC